MLLVGLLGREPGGGDGGFGWGLWKKVSRVVVSGAGMELLRRSGACCEMGALVMLRFGRALPVWFVWRLSF